MRIQNKEARNVRQVIEIYLVAVNQNGTICLALVLYCRRRKLEESLNVNLFFLSQLYSVYGCPTCGTRTFYQGVTAMTFRYDLK